MRRVSPTSSRKKTLEPGIADAARCIRLRIQSKQGQYLREADQSWVSRIFEEFPDWYYATESQVFEASKPFGSR